MCRASTREKYRERGRRWWISRRFSQEKEGDCLKEMTVMLISRLRTSQRARNVAFSTTMMCFLFLSRWWRPLSFLSVVSTKRGENWERKDISKREKKPSREGAKPVGVALSREELWSDSLFGFAMKAATKARGYMCFRPTKLENFFRQRGKSPKTWFSSRRCLKSLCFWEITARIFSFCYNWPLQSSPHFLHTLTVPSISNRRSTRPDGARTNAAGVPHEALGLGRDESALEVLVLSLAIAKSEESERSNHRVQRDFWEGRHDGEELRGLDSLPVPSWVSQRVQRVQRDDYECGGGRFVHGDGL